MNQQFLCDCSCSDLCPLGKTGMEPRCTFTELRTGCARLKCDLAHTQADRDAALALVDMRQRECAMQNAAIHHQAQLISNLEQRLREAEARLLERGED